MVDLLVGHDKPPALRYGSGRSSLGKPNRWLSVRYADRSSLPPTDGRFEGGRGVFFGDDVEGGVPVKVRFDWTAGAAPAWEQAMSADGGRTWEKNW